MCVIVHGGQRLTLGVVPQVPSTLFFEVGSLIVLEVVDFASLAASGYTCLNLPSAGVTHVHHHA